MRSLRLPSKPKIYIYKKKIRRHYHALPKTCKHRKTKRFKKARGNYENFIP